MKSPGQIGYEAYYDFAHGLSLVDGRPLPLWPLLRSEVKEGWEAAARAIRKDQRDFIKEEVLKRKKESNG